MHSVEHNAHEADIFSSHKQVILAVILVLVLALAGLATTSVYRYFDPDEIESLHAAWKILQGGVIYRDFFEHHHPLSYLLMVPFLAITAEDAAALVWMRLFNLVLVGGILLAAFEVGRRLFDVAAALVGLVLLVSAPIFGAKVIELRPDVLQTFFGLVGLVLLIDHFERRRWYGAVAGGLALGLAFATLQKAAFPVLAVGCIVGLRVVQKRLSSRDAAALAAGFAAALLPFVAWMGVSGALDSFWLLNYRLNTAQAYVAGPVETLRHTPQVYLILIDSLGRSPLLWGFFVVGLIGLLRPRPDVDPVRARLRAETAFIAVALVAWVVVLNKYYAQYYLPALPLVALIAGGAMLDTLRHRPLILGVLLAAVALASLGDAARSVRVRDNRAQLARIDRVLALTDADDPVLDGRNAFNVFRPDITYVWFVNQDGGVLAAYEHLTGHTYDILHRIEAKKPKIIAKHGLPPGAWPEEPRLADYRPLPGDEDLLILKNSSFTRPSR